MGQFREMVNCYMKEEDKKKMAKHFIDIIKKPFQTIRREWLRTRIPLERNTVKYVAHRGLSAEAPENTVKAFELAAQLRFDAMETDIRRTKDHKLVLMHDASLKRMCGVDRYVKDLTYQELKEIPVTGGRHPERYQSDPTALYVPLLSQYLEICMDSGMVPMMELKDNWNKKEALDDEYLSDILTVVREIMGDLPVIFVSFNLGSLISMKRIAKDQNMDKVTLFHLVKKVRELDLTWYKKAGIHLSIQGKANTLREIRKVNEAGLRTVIWTVDDKDQARLYIREKVEWIASNGQLWNEKRV